MKKPLRYLILLGATVTLPFAGFAADHGDSPASGSDPTTDITDLYAWMSNDAESVNLIVAVNPDAGSSAQFSDQVLYDFFIGTQDSFGAGDEGTTRITCHFPSPPNVECWVIDENDGVIAEYVAGDPSDESGVLSADGGLRVFAGLRNDPFFLDYDAFLATVDAAKAAVIADEIAMFDQGCPVLSAEQATALQGLLLKGDDATNTFAGQNVLALVLQLDKELISGNGDILGVWVASRSKG